MNSCWCALPREAILPHICENCRNDRYNLNVQNENSLNVPDNDFYTKIFEGKLQLLRKYIIEIDREVKTATSVLHHEPPVIIGEQPYHRKFYRKLIDAYTDEVIFEKNEHEDVNDRILGFIKCLEYLEIKHEIEYKDVFKKQN